MKDLYVSILAFIFAVLCLIVPNALSWLATCGLVKIATMCFGYEFTWALGTGIWVILLLLYLFCDS